MKSDPAEPSPSIRSSAYPMLWISAVFACGIAASILFPIDWRITLAAAAGLSVCAILLRGRDIAFLSMALAFFLLGAFCHQVEYARVRDDRIKKIYDDGVIASGEPVEIEGFLLARAEPAFDGVFLRLKTDKLKYRKSEQNVSGIVRFFLPIKDLEPAAELDDLNLQSGSRIRVSCNLIREDQYLNPGVMPRRLILDQQGIDAVATVKSPFLIEKLEQKSWFSPFDYVYAQRQKLIEAFRQRFNQSTAGVMIASLLGDKYFLDRDTADVFREGGTFHVLVISGLHITFIGGLVLLIVQRFTRRKILHLLIVGSFLGLYTFAVGAEVPVVRASLMFTILLLSQAIYRKGTLLNALGLCCLILLAWRPSDLFNASFQLTIISVGAIIAMAFPLIEKLRAIGSWTPDASHPFPANVPIWLKRFCEMLYWREAVWEIERGRQIWSAGLFKAPYVGGLALKGLQPIVAYLFEGVVVSVIVQLWLLPLLVVYFHRVSVVSIFLNLWVGVVMALESFAALIAITLAQLSETLALPLIRLTELLNWLLLSIPGMAADAGWASFRLPVYSGPMKAIYFLYMLPVVLLAFGLYCWNPFEFGKSTKNVRCVLMNTISVLLILALGFLIVFHPYSTPKPDGKLHIDFLDVGQGDSAFITFPNGQTMLVDGGGRVGYDKPDDEDDTEPFEPDVPRIGEFVVSEFLWEKGYSHVDHVVATHADADHAQGLEDVVRNFDVGRIYFGSLPDGASEINELFNEAARHGIETVLIGRGDVLEIAETRVEILWPEKSRTEKLSDNNSSIVMRIVYGNHSFLLTGDIERETETALTAGGAILKADVVKVPHHGSRTSSTQAFIESVDSKTAVISVGRRSPFGHPHPEVVERWNKANVSLIKTGDSGTISILTDGTQITISTFVPANSAMLK